MNKIVILGEGGGPKYTNRLAKEQSPYLLQHAHNPVDWYPWGEEAFAKAQEEDKPIFLSVGYSTCHWCHVMERESFESEAIAELMNKYFVNIKVDREERPDVDRVYMTFIQAASGGGGWPMSVWLTPELKPITGGTYFPPKDAYDRPGFFTVLERIASAWENEKGGIREQGDSVIEKLQGFASEPNGAERGLKMAWLAEAGEQFFHGVDKSYGGFGSAPKFPRPSVFIFLLSEAKRLGRDSVLGKRALDMALVTLEKMASGGIFDHLGGGFHRYSVDKFWHVPHYEKMLYDQAQLAEVYLLAYQMTNRAEFAEVAREVLDYVLRDLEHEGGGFYSAEDADSFEKLGGGEKKEGAFYVWEKDEIEEVLGERAEVFSAVYGVEGGGNSPVGSDPHEELKGKNTLIKRLSEEVAAKEFGMPSEVVREWVLEGKKKLFGQREKRPRPHLDDKVLTAWNGLMVTAFAKGYQVLEEEKYLWAAQRTVVFLRAELYDVGQREICRSWRGKRADIKGFVEDYAYLIHGLLDLYEADLDVSHLLWALELQQKQDELFWDEKEGGYFSSSGQDSSILLRLKENYDSAEPSPNTVSAQNLLRLSPLLGKEKFRKQARRCLESFRKDMGRAVTSAPLGLVAIDWLENPGQHVVIVGKREDEFVVKMLSLLRGEFSLKWTWALLDEESRGFFEKQAEIYKSANLLDGKATAYVCKDFACQLPTNDLEECEKQLKN